ncbi:MAG: methylmalonyl-CoA epimerase [Myxococcaceae bacterium]
MKNLDHIGIATANLTQSLEFFEKSLGLTCSHIEELPDRGIRVAFLPLGNTRLELIEPMHDNSEISGFLAKRGPGLHHIALSVENVPNNLETLEPLRPGAHGAQVAFVHPKKTGGVLLELCVHES